MFGLRIPFTADSTKFDKGLAHMRNGSKALGRQIEGSMTSGRLGFLKAAGGAGLLAAGVAGASAALGRIGKNSMEFGSTISDQALEANMSLEAFQTTLALALDAGRKPEQLIAAFKNITTRAVDAANGNKTYQEAFKRMNIDVEEFLNLPTERKIEMVSKGFHNGAKDAVAYRDILTILGEDAGPKMLEILDRIGSEGFDNLNTKMKESNRILSEDQIRALDEAEDAWQRFFHKLKVGAAGVTSAVIDMLGTRGEQKRQEIQEGFNEALGDELKQKFGATETGPKYKKGYLPGQRKAEFERNQKERLEKEAVISQENAKKETILKAQKQARSHNSNNSFFKGVFATAKKMASDMDRERSSAGSRLSQVHKAMATVQASSLQRIGGGGTVAAQSATQMNLLRNQEKHLRELVQLEKAKNKTGMIGPMQAPPAKAG